MPPTLESKRFPTYAWWIIAAFAVTLACFVISNLARSKSDAVLARTHIVAPQSDASSTQTDYVAQANDWILARDYRRSASIAGSLVQPLTFACILLAGYFAPRRNGKRFPWSAWPVLGITVALAGSNITGTLVSDRISDQIDLTSAQVWLGAASQAELDPLRAAQAGVSATLLRIGSVYFYCMLAFVPIILVQAIIYRWPERSRPLPTDAPITT